MNAAEPYLRLRFFPHSRISQVALLQVRDELIAGFERWGCPVAVKVDNGHPFGDPQRKSTPVLALWLISSGIDVIWNRPRQPTDNAKVERMQGTSKRWADLDRCRTTAQLAKHLDEVARLQREHYAVSRLKFQTRQAAFPGLFEVKRPYSAADFDARRAYRFLAETTLLRKVASNGRISLYEHGYQVGLKYKHQTVSVGFDAEQVAWIFQSQDGQEIKRVLAQHLSPVHIWSLSVNQRTASSDAT